jgi:hypothetical protein
MSSYLAISAVSKALKNLLWDAFEVDAQIKAIVNNKEAIVFDNPTETAKDPAKRLSLFLYEVTEDEHVKNQPMQRDDARERTRVPPLALDFGYLVTPFAPSGEANHLLLGKTMQVLYDNATTLLVTADNVAEELRIVLRRLTLEELTLVWQALREPYRLSVCYEVRVTRLDSLRTPVAATIVDRHGEFGFRQPGGPGGER